MNVGVVKRTFIPFLVLLIAFTTAFCVFEKRVVKVGLLVNLSGRGGKAGFYIRDGVVYAIGRFSRSLPFKVKLEVKDYAGSRDVMKRKIDEFAREGVPVVIGPVTSSFSVAAVDYLKKTGFKILLITPYTATTELSGKKDLFVRTSPDNRLFAKAFWLWCRENDVKTIYLVVDFVNKDFTIDIYRNIIDTFGKSVNIRHIFFNSAKDTGFLDRASEIASSRPDAVLLLTRGRETAFFTQKLRMLGYGGRIVATIWAQTPDTIKWAGGYGDGLEFISFVRPKYTSRSYLKVAEDFQEKMGYPLNARSVRAVEAVQVLFEALKDAEESCGITPGCVLRNLVGRKFYNTVMGSVTIDGFGDAKRRIYLMKAEGGRLRFVKVLLDGS